MIPSSGSSSNTSPGSSPSNEREAPQYEAAEMRLTARNIVDFENACAVVVACAEEMNALWLNEDVQAVLMRNEIRLGEGPGL